MHRPIRRSQLPAGLAAAVAAAASAGAVAAPAPHAPLAAADAAAASGAAGAAAGPADETAVPDLAVPAPAAMRWAARGALRPLAVAAQRRSAVRRARRRVVRRRALGVVRAARSRIGASYAFGAAGPGAFDCSGLTAWAMRRAGVALPRSSFAQAGVGTPVARGSIRAGDLVFFSTAGPGASHVGIATGPATVVSATTHGVMTHAISDSYWGSAYEGARRVIARRR